MVSLIATAFAAFVHRLIVSIDGQDRPQRLQRVETVESDAVLVASIGTCTIYHDDTPPSASGT